MHTYPNNDGKKFAVSFVITSPALKNKPWDYGPIFTNLTPKFLST